MTSRISRRTVLRGLGAAVALPMFECMSPLTSFANAASEIGAHNHRPAPHGLPLRPQRHPHARLDAKKRRRRFRTAADAGRPAAVQRRHACHQRTHASLGPSQRRRTGRSCRAMAVYLTGCHAKKTEGADIHLGISVDQVAAQQVGLATPFPSLELGCEAGKSAGSCDNGYSCAYPANLAWKTDHTPVAKETNPRLVFQRLFGSDENDSSAAPPRAPTRAPQHSRLRARRCPPTE